MKRTGIVYALALVLLGLVGYFATGRESLTALIPTAFGLAALLALTLTSRSKRPGLGSTIVFVLALLGIAGTARALPAFFDFIGGAEIARPTAVICQVIMVVLSLGFVLAWVFQRRGRPAA